MVIKCGIHKDKKKLVCTHKKTLTRRFNIANKTENIDCYINHVIEWFDFFLCMAMFRFLFRCFWIECNIVVCYFMHIRAVELQTMLFWSIHSISRYKFHENKKVQRRKIQCFDNKRKLIDTIVDRCWQNEGR